MKKAKLLLLLPLLTLTTVTAPGCEEGEYECPPAGTGCEDLCPDDRRYFACFEACEEHCSGGGGGLH